MGGRNFLNQSYYTNFWYPGIESILRWAHWVQLIFYVGSNISEYLQCSERISDDETARKGDGTDAYFAFHNSQTYSR